MACAIFLVINFVHPFPFLTGHLYGVKSHIMPWGEVLYTLHGRMGLYGVLWSVLMLVVLTLPIHALWKRQYSPQKRVEVYAVLCYCGILFITASNDLLVENGMDGIFLSEFGFIIIILTMAYSLSNQLGQTLRLENEALGRSNQELEAEVARRTSSLTATIPILEEARDKAKKATEAKSFFLANMSHEIRTPMNGIIGVKELAMAHASPEQQQHLNTIGIAATRLLTVINNILDFSKIDSQRMELSPHSFNLEAVINKVIDQYIPTAQHQNFSLRLDISPPIPESMEGDSHRLCQIIANLISHVMAVSKLGEITIHISSTPPINGEDYRIEFALKTPGFILNKNIHAEHFLPFPQEEIDFTSPTDSSRLGLSIARSLIRLMGGKLTLLDAGETINGFRFSLPFSATKTTPKASPTVVLPQKTNKNCHILLAEDEEINQMLASTLLEQQGIAVSCVNNGQQAVDQFSPGSYDLILMDIQMPILDGFAATALIRQQEPVGEHIPIIATTAHAMPGYHQQCLQAGMDDFLMKPYQGTELLEMIHKWLGNCPK